MTKIVYRNDCHKDKMYFINTKYMKIKGQPKMKPQHTKTPWSIGYWSGQCHINHKHNVSDCKYDYYISKPRESNDYSSCCIAGGDKENYFDVIHPPEMYEYNKEIYAANAKFIVKAVNSHDELVEALKEAVNYIKGDFIDADGIVEKLENALKNAEGGN